MTAVARLLSASPLDQLLTRACALLSEGKHGAEQPEFAQHRLATLERHGLAMYSPEFGWFLTVAGKMRRRIYVSEGREALRAVARAVRES